jgi:hypothetical protein
MADHKPNQPQASMPVLPPGRSLSVSFSEPQDREWLHKAAQLGETQSMNFWIGLLGGLAVAVLFGWVVGAGKIEAFILMAVWFLAAFVIVFIHDYWWAPLILITALSFKTYALGFAMTGLEIGMVILALTVPVKLAIRTLTPAKPKLEPGLIFWMLLLYTSLHFVVIYHYSKMEGIGQLKNMIKAYYQALVPLAVYWLLIKYCHTRTVKPVMQALIGIYFVVVLVAIPIILLGIQVPPFTQLRIQVDWADAMSAFGAQRQNAPLLFIISIAFWPALRTLLPRLFLSMCMVVALAGTVVSAGRAATGGCLAALGILCLIRKKFVLLSLAAASVVALSAVITANPEVLHALPDQVHRALVILNFSEQTTSIQDTTDLSDQWHEDLRKDSIPYWFQDLKSFFLGHGFKSWDESYTMRQDYGADYFRAKTMAIQMGRTENSFSAITNIFGLIGLLLYVGLLVHMAKELWWGHKLAPPFSYERANCEFSLTYLLLTLVFFPFFGGVPNINLIFFQLGILAVRPYLAEAKEKSRRAKERRPQPREHTPGSLPSRA